MRVSSFLSLLLSTQQALGAPRQNGVAAVAENSAGTLGSGEGAAAAAAAASALVARVEAAATAGGGDAGGRVAA